MRIAAIALTMLLQAACVVWPEGAATRPTNSAQDISVEVSRGAVGYDPEIGTVLDGVVNDLRPTVSEDLRYVQINVGSGTADIIEIDDFVVVTD